jgi:hypothetical protein
MRVAIALSFFLFIGCGAAVERGPQVWSEPETLATCESPSWPDSTLTYEWSADSGIVEEQP